MQWTEILTWLSSVDGSRVVTSAIVPFVAIVAAVLISSVIARGSITKLIERSDRVLRAAIVAELIGVARKASTWGSLTAGEQDRLDALSREASTRLRLVSHPGASSAATWAEHQLSSIKRDAHGFTAHAEQGYIELRDTLTQWHHKPRSIRKKFAEDLHRFAYAEADQGAYLMDKQREWEANQTTAQTDEPSATSTMEATPTTAASTSASTATIVATIDEERVQRPER